MLSSWVLRFECGHRLYMEIRLSSGRRGTEQSQYSLVVVFLCLIQAQGDILAPSSPRDGVFFSLRKTQCRNRGLQLAVSVWHDEPFVFVSSCLEQGHGESSREEGWY